MSENGKHIEDYLLDPDFNSWVRNPNSEDDKYWDAWLKNNNQNKHEFLKAKQLSQSFRFEQLEAPEDAHDRVLMNIIDQMEARSAAGTRR